MDEVENVICGSLFAVCDKILSNMSIKLAAKVIKDLEVMNPNDDEIIESQNKVIYIIKDIQHRLVWDK